MKKHLAVATGLALLSSSAFATKARLQALGQGDTSKFINDSRNVFLNPASLNQMTNYVVTEWGTNQTADESNTAPGAEGGFFNKSGSLNYGLYFGSERDAFNSDLNTNNFLAEDNNIDLFFAGNMGFDWGARLSYNSSEDKSGSINKESDGMGLGLGIQHGKIGAYANLKLSGEAKGDNSSADNKVEADLGLNVGVSYKHKDSTFYVDYDKSGWEKTISGVTDEKTVTSYTVGWAKSYAMTETAMVFVDVNYNSMETETVNTTTTETETTTGLPVTIGFEAEANSWLTLRASISQNVVINDYEKETTGSNKEEKNNVNNTAVNAGATMTFGKFIIDGVIGTTPDERNGSSTSGNGTNEGVLSTDNLMTRVGVTYNF